jgi:hypothetical protein
MTASKTATVETLTAEVRVLMVGSRQVTMSVYNQLDQVTPAEIEPFGRVAPKTATGGWVHVIGRHTDSGVLVRAFLPGAPGDPSAGERYIANLRVKLDEARARARAHEARRVVGSNLEKSKVLWQDLVERRTAEIAEWEDGLSAMSAKWCALPLIVLAGLR